MIKIINYILGLITFLFVVSNLSFLLMAVTHLRSLSNLFEVFANIAFQLKNILEPLFPLIGAILIIIFLFGLIFSLKNKPKGRKILKFGGAWSLIFVSTWIVVTFVVGLMVKNMGVAKPVIYLYPETKTDIQVRLDFDGDLVADYPAYNYDIGGWDVTAKPDGTLYNHADGLEYSYLFWEGKSYEEFDIDKGFVVPGKETVKFLQEKLAYLGLTPKEYNEFIVYWYPLMMNNQYNLIYFAGDDYTDMAPLTITPKPDSIQRVFMVFKPLKRAIEIDEQILTPFKRTGFTVIEWGGAEI